MKALLYIEPAGLSVYSRGAAQPAIDFSADDDGARAFCEWLRQNSGVIVFVCIDYPQIVCHGEWLPPLRGRERRRYLRNLCAQLAPAAQLQSVQQSAAHKQRLAVLTTLADETGVEPWLMSLRQSQALVANVFFLPVAVAMITRTARGSLSLLVEGNRYGVRLSLCDDGTLLLNRHIHAAEELAGEIQRTLVYAHRSKLIAEPDQVVKVLLFDGAGTVVSASPQHGVADCDKATVATFRAIENPMPGRAAHLTVAAGKVAGMRNSQITAHYRSARSLQRMGIGIALLVLLCAASLMFRHSLSSEYQVLFNALATQRERVSAQLAQRDSGQLSTDKKIAALDFIERVRADAAQLPLQTLHQLAKVLQRHQPVQLRALQWHRVAPERDAQQLIVVGRIDESVVELVGAITVYRSLLESLQSAADVKVTKAPFGLATDSTDSSRISADLNDRDFRIELSIARAG